MAPRYEDIVALRRSDDTLSVELDIVTPLLGGGVRSRMVDSTDVIRPSSVRGALRFWWRAVCALDASSAADLYDREVALWGGATSADSGGRSQVDVHVTVTNASGVDESEVRLWGRDATPGAYALFRAREQHGARPAPAAQRRFPGTRFRLELRGPSLVDARAALLAWILFGGYGGATRRGLGSLRVTAAVPGPATGLLPKILGRDELARLFGRDPLTRPPGMISSDRPVLAGASLWAGTPVRSALEAWTTALDLLREFRQGRGSTSPFDS